MSARKPSLFHRDVFLSTVFTFLLIGLLGFVVINTKYLSPIYNALKDFEYTDLYYSQYKSKQVEFSDEIVLVNIGDADRSGIAEILEFIHSKRPKAIGLDVCFLEKRDSTSDAALKDAIRGPIVLANQLNYATKTSAGAAKNGAQLYVERTHPYFEVMAEGYGNFVGGEGETVRYFQPATKVRGDTMLSFVSQLLKLADLSAYRQLTERDGRAEIINYSQQKFVTLQPSQIGGDTRLEGLLTDKYVIVGYLGSESGAGSLEDLHLTPLNKSFGGHAIPDMYGPEIHAHILSMALNRTYVDTLSKPVSWILAFVITLLHMYVFLRDFVDNHMWFHLIAKVLQLVSFGLLFLAAVMIYHFGNLKIEPSLLLIAIVLSVDALYFLDGIMKWLYKKFNWHSYFIVEH